MKYRVNQEILEDIARGLGRKIALIISLKSLFYNLISFLNLNNSQDIFCDYIIFPLNCLVRVFFDPFDQFL